MTNKQYDLFLSLPAGPVHAADVVIQEEGTQLQAVGLRYRESYLEHPEAFPIDPSALPLQVRPHEFSDGHTPGFLDDYLPDDWGRRVLAQVAYYQKGDKLNANSVIDALKMLSHSRIGGLSIVDKGGLPHFDRGASIETLEKIEQAAIQLDENLEYDEASLLYLGNNGTGVGGARPKALLHDNQRSYVAKFNRPQHDQYNNARVEQATLLMAKTAGINVPDSELHEGVEGRETLLVERFDVNPDQTRNHLVSINTLLRDPATQQNSGTIFRYDDIHDVLQRYVDSIEESSRQLLLQMLFNRAINNTDDHQRNFSLIHTESGWSLSPAYDLVPSLSRGEFHQAGFRHDPSPPLLSELGKLKKVFGLPQSTIDEAVELVHTAVSGWLDVAEECGVPEEDAVRIQKAFNG